MSTWHGAVPPEVAPPGAAGWMRAVARGIPMALVVFGGLAVLLLVRGPERLLSGHDRPVTPWITVCVCRAVLRILGIPVQRHGTPAGGGGATVANHVSWLDIFVLNAARPVTFVSKAEVEGWPGIGWLARATGTLFIRRDRREARAQADLFADRLARGERLLVFPEGTSTDGQRVLPFKPTLFQAFFDDRLRHAASVQPVSLRYEAPKGAPAAFYGWWGDMDFGPSLLRALAARRQGRVSVVYHPAVPVDAHPNRKSLAHALETKVREGYAEAI
ncbi:lyso-ornithine lipid acyltransferase [Roseivivax marinus]|uniref:lysophospholipid acyltransferase family protein n=1 Tax=Roseivivax marinus TaxID=1379903 RepID=UPI0008CBDFB1|nr:lyso-ornithine lipid acyltransferase [Roseivivax marinus]